MPHQYAKTVFTDAIKRLQQRFGSRAQYERVARQGSGDETLGPFEREFIGERDSFYLATVTSDGWPYVQHRGGPKGFLRVIDGGTLAFADFSGNKQYVTAGNLATNDRVSLFLVDYPARARLKLMGHARFVEPDTDPTLDEAVRLEGYRAKVERVMVVHVVGYDWNCSQHLTPRYTREEIEAAWETGAAARGARVEE